MNDRLLKLLKLIKEDFEMLRDGSWDLNYSDGSEIEASIDVVNEAIELVEWNKRIEHPTYWNSNCTHGYDTIAYSYSEK